MTATGESGQDRGRRHYQRALFDGVADLYQSARPGYPAELVEFVVATAGLAAGSPVLEIGCGTGQLTERLAGYGFRLTATDIGPAMIAQARQRLAGQAVEFQATSFEDLAAADASADLVICGSAFHWIDPEVRFAKSARLLRPGGWLALLAVNDLYDDPVGTDMTAMFTARGDFSGAWVTQAVDAGVIAATGLFGELVSRTQDQRITRPAATVIGLESTRAASLTWPDDVRREFAAELRQYLGSQAEVPLTLRTSVMMAPVLSAPR